MASFQLAISLSFATNFGSVDSLKVRTRCGASRCASRMLCTERRLTPAAFASIRPVQWLHRPVAGRASDRPPAARRWREAVACRTCASCRGEPVDTLGHESRLPHQSHGRKPRPCERGRPRQSESKETQILPTQRAARAVDGAPFRCARTGPPCIAPRPQRPRSISRSCSGHRPAEGWLRVRIQVRRMRRHRDVRGQRVRCWRIRIALGSGASCRGQSPLELSRAGMTRLG
jgi:hypothetical protein